jgi:hypothetical protein
MKSEILYFIEGNVPTDKEFEHAQKLMNNGPIVKFVSLQLADLNNVPEGNFKVAGNVPESYSHFPKAEAVLPKAITDEVFETQYQKKSKK